MAPAQLGGRPVRRFYTGRDLARARTVGDLRARAQRRLPRFALEYLEGGAEDEATLDRERAAYADWRFVPRTLVDVSDRSAAVDLLGVRAPFPFGIAPTGLTGVFCRGADVALASAAAACGVPFVQSTMSNDLLEDIAAIPKLRHWFQLYVFGDEGVWRSLVDRAEQAGCEALVLTSNSQIFGNREWEDRTMAAGRPSLATVLDTVRYPGWLWRALGHGMPSFRNVIDHVPPDRRGFFASAGWIREQMPRSLSWGTVAAIRARWRGPFLLKGLLHPQDVRIALDSGVDGIVLSSHGGRQMDWALAPLDVLPRIRELVGDRTALLLSGGVRRGTDILKAVALGADAVLAGRAPLYGLCAHGAPGVQRALSILHRETCDAMGLLGVDRLNQLRPEHLAARRTFLLPSFPDDGGRPTALQRRLA